MSPIASSVRMRPAISELLSGATRLRAGLAVARPRVADVARVGCAPVGKCDQRLGHRPAERGERVLDPGGNLVDGSPLHETVTLECPQRVGHDFLRDPR